MAALWIIDTIPIGRGINDTLSYYTTRRLNIGTIISVPVRNSCKPALITDIYPAETNKAEIKSLDYSLRKLEFDGEEKRILTAELISAIDKTAHYYASNRSGVLANLLPSTILSHIDLLPDIQTTTSLESDPPTSHLRVQLWQARTSEQIKKIKKSIRSHSATATGNVFILVPTIVLGKFLYREISQGLEHRILLIHNSLSDKNIKETWQTIAETKEQKIIIGTTQFLSLPFKKLDTIYVYSQSHQAYKMPRRPFLSGPKIAEHIAQTYEARLIICDLLLNTPTHYRFSDQDENHSIADQYRFTARSLLIDMKKEQAHDEFSVFSELSRDLISQSLKADKKSVIFVTRKGKYTRVQCQDCGEFMRNPESQYPLIVIKHQGRNVFFDPITKEVIDSNIRCQNCQSWNLKGLGVGITQVAEVLQSYISSEEIHLISKSHTKNSKAVKKKIQKWQEEGGILLTTVQGINHLHKATDNIIVASLDTLLSLPDLPTYHDTAKLILRLRELASDNFYLQTRQADNALLQNSMSANLEVLYRQELKEREDLSYPPFSTLIKLSGNTKDLPLKQLFSRIQKDLSKYDTEAYDIPYYDRRRGVRHYLLVSVPSDQWPDNKLIKYLKSLPRALKVEVDPRSLN